MLIGILLFLIFYTLLEIICIIICFDASRKNQKVTIVDIFIVGIKKLFGLFRPSGIPVILLSAIFIPVSGLPIFSGVLTDFKIDLFEPKTISNTYDINISFILIMILITIFSLFLMLVLHFIIIEKKKFFTAFREAIVLLKNRKIKALTSVIIWYFHYAFSNKKIQISGWCSLWGFEFMRVITSYSIHYTKLYEQKNINYT